MTEYSIRLTEDNRTAVMAEINASLDKITINGHKGSFIVIDTDKATADSITAKTDVIVHEVVYADIDMGMGNSFMRGLAEIFESVKTADETIAQAKTAPVDPIDGQPAARYVVRTEDAMAVPLSGQLELQLTQSGLRVYKPEAKNLSVIFFDAVDGKQAEAIALPQGWTLQKLTP
jgi:hypothetical protein